MMCGKCIKLCGWLFLIVGILFLVRDFGGWDFWNIQWWSALFILWGLGKLAMSGCSMCQGKKKR